MNAQTVAGKRLIFNESLTIRNIEALHEALREALVTSLKAEIDLQDAAEIDLSFVQLLLAARRSAEASGKRLSLAVSAGGPLRDVLARAGIETDGFWSGEAGAA